MAGILPDREIRKIIGSILIGANEQYINPNGIELRLGENVRFDSTGEQKKLGPGLFLKVNPGESVIISSLERLDFKAETVQKIYPDKMLMGFITPTTTMMREGISQVATKVDAGFRGLLNWGFRNSSTKEFMIQYGEPIFKLTIFLLERDESPDVPYGEGARHTYQDTKGIKLSARRIPVQVDKKSIVDSGFDKLDPKKRLREAGYPFDHISTELTELHGKWEVVSSDVRIIKDDFKKQVDALSTKITEETSSISKRLDEFRETFFERVEMLFQKKFLWIVGVLVAAFAFIATICNYLRDKNVDTFVILIIGLAASTVILAITYLVARRLK
jgi:deoxycytidine triphosphate deaminase